MGGISRIPGGFPGVSPNAVVLPIQIRGCLPSVRLQGGLGGAPVLGAQVMKSPITPRKIRECLLGTLGFKAVNNIRNPYRLRRAPLRPLLILMTMKIG